MQAKVAEDGLTAKENFPSSVAFLIFFILISI